VVDDGKVLANGFVGRGIAESNRADWVRCDGL